MISPKDSNRRGKELNGAIDSILESSISNIDNCSQNESGMGLGIKNIQNSRPKTSHQVKYKNELKIPELILSDPEDDPKENKAINYKLEKDIFPKTTLRNPVKYFIDSKHTQSTTNLHQKIPTVSPNGSQKISNLLYSLKLNF